MELLPKSLFYINSNQSGRKKAMRLTSERSEKGIWEGRGTAIKI
jgi:hypothetical protein